MVNGPPPAPRYRNVHQELYNLNYSQVGRASRNRFGAIVGFKIA